MSRFTEDTRLWEVLDSTKARMILERHAPGVLDDPHMRIMFDAPIKSLAGNSRLGVSHDQYRAIMEDLQRPLAHSMPESRTRLSMDEIDLEGYDPGPSPLNTPAVDITLSEGLARHSDPPDSLLLDGEWEMAEAGADSDRVSGAWKASIPAEVPGSVHTALVKAGRIPDPTFGTNQKIAKQESFKTWWFRKQFVWERSGRAPRLIFDGVCNRCTVWLNGKKLGEHEGMFGGPFFDVAGLLEASNTLIVKLEPIPFDTHPERNVDNPENNDSWAKTVVFNNVYGWHYSNLPSLGIWRSVRIEETPSVSVADPFVSTADAASGTIDLVVDFVRSAAPSTGTLSVSVEPENFDGATWSFERRVSLDDRCYRRHYRFTLPNARLWWPVDLGDPNLYRMKVSFVPNDGEAVADHRESLFGVRTVKQAPLPEGPAPDLYNWTFVINGEPHFIKGTNWCTLDPLLDFSRQRYERFVNLAVDQHIQMFRPWGSGMPETDEFYDLCDRNGILVFQEWPTAWNSHETQPYDALEETVRLNTLRIRNHPSLAMYGGGNESSEPFGPAIDMMGRLAVELDGTRVFHRGEPWGGSLHNYNVYWGRQHFDYNLDLIAPFFGEFGVACSPPYESVQRYLPEEERDLWPPREDGAFAYHTPIFNTKQGVSRLTQYASFFLPKNCTLEEYTIASQLSQAIGLRHPLERARTRWPDCAGALYYKMNDNFPAASWATADWYGAPKIGHYVVQDAFAPLHACLLFKTLKLAGSPAEFPVYLLDDANELADKEWNVIVRAFDENLAEIERAEFTGSGSIDSPARLGDFELGHAQTDSAPLLFVVEVIAGGEVVDRTFYIANFDYEKGCLFTLPRTSVSISTRTGEVTVGNTGKVPAVCVSVQRPGHSDTFTAGDGCFWLDPGEVHTVTVSDTDGVEATAWNLEGRNASWVK